MNIKTTKKLKSCPFCGAKENSIDIQKWSMTQYEQLSIENNDGFWYQVYCGLCFASTAEDINEDKAINNWNTRKEECKDGN